ncbi:hypothetical protein [Rubritalea tangerina]|uniref:hypothetical protein n=1 Tax=Rubritalea tangerina TaxID=430798 RepID=UPI00361AE57B
MHHAIVVIQLSRAYGTPSLRLDILQAHSDHSSIPFDQWYYVRYFADMRRAGVCRVV